MADADEKRETNEAPSRRADRLRDAVSARGARGLSRRQLLIGGGVGAGLVLALALWPRHYEPNLNLAEGEQAFGAFLKIDRTGQIIVVVPQAELGQGVYTQLPQILADELGADWRTVAVQPSPISPLYANSLLAEEWLPTATTEAFGDAGRWATREYATRNALMLTGGSTSVRMFGPLFREAGAAARVLLCKAAAARWDLDWEGLDIRGGFVTDGKRQLRIGELAAEAAGHDLPDIVPLRQDDQGRLFGEDMPRLDLPSKVDGSATFAADIRLPDMAYASIRQGPIGDARLDKVNEAAARQVPGFIKLVRQDRWVACVANSWWAANKALDALDPVFTVQGASLDSEAMDQALTRAFASGDGRRLSWRGDLAPVFEKATIVSSEYRVAPALHLAMEPLAATAHVRDGRAEIWAPTQAPGLARAAVAGALGMGEAAVTLYPLMAGGSFGRKMDHEVLVQAAILSREAGRPIQLQWSRAEDIIQDRPRAPAVGRLSAKLGRGGTIEGWLAKIAAPAGLRETWARIADGKLPHEAMTDAATNADGLAISGALPPYTFRAYAIDHYPVNTGLPAGRWRSNADHYTCFFTESFVDELAHVAGIEPMSFRIQMLGGQPRLAHCLSTAAALGGWQGGIPGSGQGIACHLMQGSYIAIMVEADWEGGRPRVSRIVAAADCGDQVNPDIARQQIEGGLVFGVAAAFGASVPYGGGLPVRARMGQMGLPRLADLPEVQVEMIRSNADAGGPGEIAVPPVAPAIANALYTVAGRRIRNLPLMEAA